MPRGAPKAGRIRHITMSVSASHKSVLFLQKSPQHSFIAPGNAYLNGLHSLLHALEQSPLCTSTDSRVVHPSEALLSSTGNHPPCMSGKVFIHCRPRSGATGVCWEDGGPNSTFQGAYNIRMGPCVSTRRFPRNLRRDGQVSQEHHISQVRPLQTPVRGCFARCVHSHCHVVGMHACRGALCCCTGTGLWISYETICSTFPCTEA